MSSLKSTRRVGTHKQPLGDAMSSTEGSWGTPRRSPSEQRRDDGEDHGPAWTTGTTTTNSASSVTLEGNQWYAGGRPISVGDVDYFVGQYADPSHASNRAPKGGRGCLMSPPCLESQGCHLIPLCFLLSCSSA